MSDWNGWDGLIAPLKAELTRLGGELYQVKEKFGGLRFYYSLPLSTAGKVADGFSRQVQAAEVMSYITCEKCGKPGQLRRGD